LPAPLGASAPAEWIVVHYGLPATQLHGLSVEPELFPPILRIGSHAVAGDSRRIEGACCRRRDEARRLNQLRRTPQD
jgi:hypothetical protein